MIALRDTTDATRVLVEQEPTQEGELVAVALP